MCSQAASRVARDSRALPRAAGQRGSQRVSEQPPERTSSPTQNKDLNDARNTERQSFQRPNSTELPELQSSVRARLAAGADRANTSLHLIRPVSCMAAKSVRIEPMVIARPVNPLKKNA